MGDEGRVTKLASVFRFTTSKSVDFVLASDSESAFYVDVGLRRTHIHLARYRSPGKDRQIARCEWIQFLVVRNEMVYLGTLLSLDRL